MIKQFASAIGLAGIIVSSSSYAVTAASDYLRITDEQGKIQKTPWVTNTPLGSSNTSAERAVIAIHSIGQDAIWYYSGIEEAAQLAGEFNNTMLYSLQFLRGSEILDNNLQSDLEIKYWADHKGWKDGEPSVTNCAEYTATVAEHESAGRAYSETTTEGEICYGTFCWGGTEVTTWYATGSDDDLGTDSSTNTTLFKNSLTYDKYEAGNCPTNIGTGNGYSSYAFVDVVMKELLDETRYPNLKQVVVAGHSAGGQFVNRYAAGNLIHDMLEDRGVKVRYIVAAPSTYIYMDNKRPDTAISAVNEGNSGNNGQDDYGVTNIFEEVPDTTDENGEPIKLCKYYNHYKHGLDNLNEYMLKNGADNAVAAQTIKQNYKTRNTIYMVGELDDMRASSRLENDCEANLQGRHRKERSLNYMNHIAKVFGEDITGIHEQVIIPGVGHNGPNQFKSELGRTYMFPNLDDGIEHSPTVVIENVDTSGNSIIVIGSANDKDGNLQEVQASIPGYHSGRVCSGTSNWSCTFPTLEPGDYVANAVAIDDLGNTSEVMEISFTIEEPVVCEDFTDTIANHESAGRAYSETTIEGQTCYGTFCWGGTEVTTWYAAGSAENLGQDSTATITLKTVDGGFASGECPVEPTAPKLHTGYSFNIHHYGMYLGGSAVDPDYDIERVEFQIGSSTVLCDLSDLQSYSVSFYCNIDFEEAGIAVGEEYTHTVTVYDKAGLSDSYTDPYPDTRPENSAPEMDYEPSIRTSGSTAELYITATDKDRNLEKFIITTDSGDTVECLVTEPDSRNHTCIIENQSIGEHTAEIQAFDSHGAASSLVSFSYTITEEHIPSIDSWEATVNGTTLIVTGTASDGDGSDDIEQITVSAFVGVPCVGTANFTCTWPEAGFPGETKSFALHIRDKNGNERDYWTAITVTFPEQPSCITATNSAHGDAGRAELRYSVLYYAIGSNDYLGQATDTTSLEETSEGVWTKVTSCQ